MFLKLLFVVSFSDLYIFIYMYVHIYIYALIYITYNVPE